MSRDDDELDLSRVAERIRARTGSEMDKRRRRRATSISGRPFDAPTPPPESEPVFTPVPRSDSDVAEQIARAPGFWQRYDLWVVLAALAVFATGTLAVRRMTAPETTRLSHAGLSLARPSGWLPVPVTPPPSPLAAAAAPDEARSAAERARYHVVFVDPRAPLSRLEVQIERRPSYGNLRGVLALDRAARYGEYQWAAETSDESIAGRDWVRTRYRYALRTGAGESPRTATAIEYAAVSGNLSYVVTLHGAAAAARELEALVAPTLDVEGGARP